MPSLSSRMEAADANAHKLRATLAVTEAAIPTPIFRATPPTLSRDGVREPRPQRYRAGHFVDGFAVRVTRHDPINRQAERGQIVPRRIDIAARRHENSHLDRRGISCARFGSEPIHDIIGRPGRQALDLVADDSGQELARLRRHGYSPYENLVGREFENDKIVVGRALDIFRNFHPRGQGRENVSCLSVAQHRISGRLGPPNHDMLVLARDNQRTTFAPAVTPGQKQCREDFDPSFPDSADAHDFAFVLSDDPLEEPWGWYRGPDKYAIR